MTEREGASQMDMQIAIDATDTTSAYAELGRGEAGAIGVYIESAGDTPGAADITWTREQAIAFHSHLGHLLYAR